MIISLEYLFYIKCNNLDFEINDEIFGLLSFNNVFMLLIELQKL